MRFYLMRLPGVGPKTASWIVRNWLNSNEVAILDIHVIRAGQLMNLFTTSERVEAQYFEMEQRFLDLAEAIDVPAADLDALIWSEMRRTPRLVAKALMLGHREHYLAIFLPADPGKSTRNAPKRKPANNLRSPH